MQDFHFSASVLLPYPLIEVFDYLSDASKLQELTPPWVHFSILSPTPIEMRQGVLIRYRIGLRGLSVRWDSEITRWDPPFGFTDEQRRGPYRLWVHRHEFEETTEGTLATDEITYRVPGGALLNGIYVAPELHRIFAYREERLHALFP